MPFIEGLFPWRSDDKEKHKRLQYDILRTFFEELKETDYLSMLNCPVATLDENKKTIRNSWLSYSSDKKWQTIMCSTASVNEPDKINGFGVRFRQRGNTISCAEVRYNEGNIQIGPVCSFDTRPSAPLPNFSTDLTGLLNVCTELDDFMDQADREIIRNVAALFADYEP